MLDQVARAGPTQAQIAFKRLPKGEKHVRRRVSLEVKGSNYCVLIGDTSAIWRSHQDPSTAASFEELFAFLSDQPDVSADATLLEQDPGF